MKIDIQLLGTLQVSVAGQPLSGFRSDKARALLAYIATTPDAAHDRAALAALLWPDYTESAAKTGLRSVLSNLRKLLPDALTITRRTAQLNTEAVTTDISRFQHALSHDKAAAVALYQGAFLRSLSLPESTPFNEWRTLVQERLHQQMMGALTDLTTAAQAQKQWQTVAALAQQQLGMVAWHEPAHRALITALLAQGDQAAAMAQYELCRSMLRDELGVEPSAETKALLGEIVADMPVRTNLPRLQALIGRADQAQKAAALLDSSRLVTLLGPGGIGKSVLAQAVGRDLLATFDDGVWLVSLTGIGGGESATENICAAIGAALSIDFAAEGSLLEQLQNALAAKHLLLILDNFEQLVGSASRLLSLLEHAPNIRLLVTSRVRLNLQDERIVALRGLPGAAGARLFVERSQRIMPEFVATADDLTAIDRIVVQVEGLPLGIELAAIWVEHFTPTEIAASIAESHAFLEDGGDGRQSSVQAAFEHSWRLLSQQEQGVLAQLSVFLGEFGRTATLAITDADLTTLSALMSKSLLRRVRAGRYSLHPVVREFSAEKQTDRPQTAARYSLHYLTQIQNDNATAATLQPDTANILTAWRIAVRDGSWDLLSDCSLSFKTFIDGVGLLRDGLNLFEQAAENAPDEVAAKLLLELSEYYSVLDGSKRAIEILEHALTLTSDPRVRHELYATLGKRNADSGNYEAALQAHALAEAAAHATGDKLLLANAIATRAGDNVLHFQGDFAHSIERLEYAYELVSAESNAEKIVAQITWGLQIAYMRYGQFDKAIIFPKRDLEIARSKHNAVAEMDSLLDVGLIQLMAGVYDEAREATLASLSIAKEVEDTELVGLLNANLCLVERNAGNLHLALQHGNRAIPILNELGSKRMEGQARIRTAHVHAALEQWAEAETLYATGAAIMRELGNPNLYEALAGRAAVLMQLDRLQEAQTMVDEVLNFAQDDVLLRFVEPVHLLLNCAAVLEAVGQSQRAQAVLTQANDWVQTIASRNEDPAIRRAYLSHIPAHRNLALLHG